MRFLFTMLLCCTIGGVAGAVDWNLSPVAPDKDVYEGDGASDGREGGETFGDAVPIGSLPYSDTGATCDNVPDIYGSCHYDQGAPDVVYSYTPGANELVTVSLCGSQYDTALSVFDAGFNEIYCNDDYCGLQSELQDMPLSAGSTYYFVVDGYYTACGSYVINVTTDEPCALECPQGALDEGEPDCYDNYYDETNGGCNSMGWTEICPQDGNSAVMCGTSGTYLYNGLSYRDTDWISVFGAGGDLTATCEAVFPLQFIYFYVIDYNCYNYAYDYVQVPPCTPATFTYNVAEGAEQWLWVGGSQFSGIPCGSLWVLTVDGIWCEGTAVESTSWGAIKNLYR